MADSCFKCLSTCGCKYLLVICNSVLLSLGLAIIAFDGYLVWKSSSDKLSIMTLMMTDLMIVTGVVAVVLILAGIMGIRFAENRSRCSGIVYIIFIVLVVLISMAYALGPETFLDELRKKVKVIPPCRMAGQCQLVVAQHQQKVLSDAFFQFSKHCDSPTVPAVEPKEEIKCEGALDGKLAAQACPNIHDLGITRWWQPPPPPPPPPKAEESEEEKVQEKQETTCTLCQRQLSVNFELLPKRIMLFCRSVDAFHAFFSVGSFRLQMLVSVFGLVVLVLAIWLVICGPESQDRNTNGTVVREVEMVVPAFSPA